MNSQNLNPWLSINAEEIEPTAVRIEKYPDYNVEEGIGGRNQTKNVINMIK